MSQFEFLQGEERRLWLREVDKAKIDPDHWICDFAREMLCKAVERECRHSWRYETLYVDADMIGLDYRYRPFPFLHRKYARIVLDTGMLQARFRWRNDLDRLGDDATAPDPRKTRMDACEPCQNGDLLEDVVLTAVVVGAAAGSPRSDDDAGRDTAGHGGGWAGDSDDD